MERAAAEGKLIVDYQHVVGSERTREFERNVLSHPKVIALRDRFVWLEGALDPNDPSPRARQLMAGVDDTVKIRVFDAGMTRVLAWEKYAQQLTPERFLALLASAREGPEAFERWRVEREADIRRRQEEADQRLRER